MDDSPDGAQEPANLRFLRILVTILTASMIGGLVTVIVLIVIKVPEVVKTNPMPLPLPDTITLPDGSRATNFTQGTDWYGVVTADNRILIFDRKTGKLRQTVTIRPR